MSTVAYVKAYFNSSSPQRQGDWQSRCSDPGAQGAVCPIPEMTPTNTTPTGWFFSYQNNMTNNQTISGKNDGSRSGVMVWSLLSTVLLTLAWLSGVW